MLNPLASLADFFGTVFNSGFAVAAVGALAGAAAGALGAQRVIERTKRRRELLDEIRDANAAIMISFSITNTTLRFKHQLIGPMCSRFNKDREAFQSFLASKSSGERQGNAPFSFEAELNAFMCPALPMDTLKNLVYHRVNSYGKPLELMAQVENAAAGLAHSIAKRDNLAETIKLESNDEAWAYRYFGIRNPEGNTHREYADLVAVIDEYASDLLWFSNELSSELVKYGEALREHFLSRYGRQGVPNVSSPDFSRPRASGLFPPDSAYNSWAASISER